MTNEEALETPETPEAPLFPSRGPGVRRWILLGIAAAVILAIGWCFSLPLELVGPEALYVNVQWAPVAGVSGDAIRDDIARVAAGLGFEHGYDPFEGAYLARGPDVGTVADLQDELRLISAGRFTFAITYSSSGHPVYGSPGLDSDALRRVVDGM